MIVSNNVESMSSLNGVPYLHNLINNEGVTYKEFRKSLKLNLRTIIRNMMFPWLMIMLLIIIFLALKASFWWSVLLILPSSFWIAFWMQSYTSHFHEAAHFNIHQNKAVNDLLSDIFLTPFTGLRAKDYRVSHWKHHRFLGQLEDTEISYHNPISFMQVIEGLTGIYLLKTILRYFNNFRDIDSINTAAEKKTNAFVWSLSFMLITQLLIILGLYYFISLTAAIAWLISVFVTGPFIASLRQTLEHRSYTAQKNTDYSRVVHGPVNRIFGTDFFSRHFGGAGFNRHLLHHCDPSVSYTRFDELEQFLLNTSVKDFIESNRTTYLKTFFALEKQ